MKRYTTYLASCAILAFGATAAHANCDELAALIGEDPAAASAGETGGEIEKDGSTAPLETDADAGVSGDTGSIAAGDMETGDTATGETADTSGMDTSATDTSATDTGATDTGAADTGEMDTGEGEIAKDASTAPLEDEAAVPESDGTPIATSPAGVEAQQEDATMEDGATGTATGDMESTWDPETLERAREALASGDDEACLLALQELQS